MARRYLAVLDGGAGAFEQRRQTPGVLRRHDGSKAPEMISTGLPVRSAAGGFCSGTIARSRAAPKRASGHSCNSAPAILAPFEKPTAIS